MNLQIIQQLMKSGNPMQSIMNMMNPQQKMIAQQFLNNPNRAQALEELKKQYNVSDDQIKAISKFINS